MAVLLIGDTVTVNTAEGEPKWDGTVVDIIDPKGHPPTVRVYWRYPLGKVNDHYASELQRVK